jgi:hypothetical protein
MTAKDTECKHVARSRLMPGAPGPEYTHGALSCCIDSGRYTAARFLPSDQEQDVRAHWLLGFIEGIEAEIIDLIAAGDNVELLEKLARVVDQGGPDL